jgi:uncharacterized heparinase superfamily protein
VLCGVYETLVRGRSDEADYLKDIRRHAAFVRLHLEHDVGGNHLIKNLKALVGLGVFLNDDRLLALGRSQLGRQSRIQVLSDGGHYERSPSYHCQVLADLIDVADLLDAAGSAPVARLAEAVGAMRRWLGAMLMPDGDVPLFNDCVRVGEKAIKLLDAIRAPEQRVTVLKPSGFVVMHPDDPLHLIADVGPPCPRELPAHAHADCLSFELAIDGQRVIIDTGTSSYEPGERRAYERSTAAHNTVEVDGVDQTEVWGAFRAARRAHPTFEAASDDGETIEVSASHDGYRSLSGGPRHRRTWRVWRGGVEITDEVTGRGSHHVVARLHAAPGLPVEASGREGRIGPLVVTAAAPAMLLKMAASVARTMGKVERTDSLAVATAGALPLRMTVALRRLHTNESFE